MSQTIWKFPLRLRAFDDAIKVEAPRVMKWLRVGMDGSGDMCVWGLLDPEGPTEVWDFSVYPTGLVDERGIISRTAGWSQTEYVGSVEMGSGPGWMIFHVFCNGFSRS